MEIIPFEPWHIVRLQPHAFLQPDPNANRLQIGQSLKQMGPAFSGVYDGQIVAAGGVAIQWPGVGLAWVYADDCLRKFGKSAARHVQTYLKQIMSEENLHRVQAYVHADYSIGQRFITWLGFRCEGVAEAFDIEGNNWQVYAKIKKGR